MQRSDVEFRVEGAHLRGWLYRPDVRASAPAVLMSHGFTAVKEMALAGFAECFAAAGFAVLVVDHRGFGTSGGAMRQEVDPVQQVRDLRDALTWLAQQPGINAARLGIWGTSYSAGHAITLAAIDRRLRCVVAQVPFVSGLASFRRVARADLIGPTRAMFDADRVARLAGAPPTVIPVTSADPAQPCALPMADAHLWFTNQAHEQAPAWRNAVTLRSVELYSEYEPVAHIAAIAPTPLLMIVADQDTCTPTDLALDAYEKAREPKRLLMVPGGHFSAYGGEGFERGSRAARDWFVEHLT